MPYVLLIFGKITTNKHTVQYAKTRIFISKFRSFFCENLRVFRKITAVGNRSARLHSCDKVIIVEIWRKTLLASDLRGGGKPLANKPVGVVPELVERR